MDAGAAIRSARERAQLSKRELARRAATSPAAIVAYEKGSRTPTVTTLDRILRATGQRIDPVVAGRRLEQVLALAEHLPRRRARRMLPYPRFG